MNLTLTASDAPDADLIRAHRAGDTDAFGEIARRYLPRLTRFLLGRVGDAASAEDLAQETLLKALGSIDRFDADRPLWPWLRTIAANAAVDASRARGRSVALARALGAQMPSHVENPDVAEADLLRDALADVPERQRAALERCYVEGWRPVDAAASFGVGSNAFEQLLHRARRNLRAAYMRRDGQDRAAGLAWLLLAMRPILALGNRMRSVGVLGGRAAEVGIAAATAGILAVAVPMAATPPPPRQQAPIIQQATTPAEQIDPLGADGLETAPDTTRGEVDAQPGGGGAAAAGVPSFSARPAPVAAPAADTDAGTGPVDVDVPGVEERGEDEPAPVDPGSVTPGPGRDPSPDEVIGGCGSTVREVVCTVTD